MANAAECAAARVTLQSDGHVGYIAEVSADGQDLIIVFVANRREAGAHPVRFKVEACGTTKTAEAIVVVEQTGPEPVGITTVIGRQERAQIPFVGQLRKAASFEAHLEPQVQEFRLTSTTGTMEVGMKMFPFSVVFAPKEPKAMVVLLVVVFDGTEEYTVQITGGVSGFQSRSWAGQR
jgi:hypothetical protein